MILNKHKFIVKIMQQLIFVQFGLQLCKID